MSTRFRKSIVAAVAVLALTAMGAADAQRSRGGGGGGVAVSGGGFRGQPGRTWSGGAWVGTGRPGWGPGWRHPGWRPGWGPGWAGWGGWGWGGWGWGLGWNAWGWNPGFWGWSVGVPVVVNAPVSGAWVLPPSAQPQVWIERQGDDVPAAAPAASTPGQWWYWCASAQAYYPYVQTCAEDWQRVAPRVPAGVQ